MEGFSCSSASGGGRVESNSSSFLAVVGGRNLGISLSLEDNLRVIDHRLNPGILDDSARVSVHHDGSRIHYVVDHPITDLSLILGREVIFVVIRESLRSPLENQSDFPLPDILFLVGIRPDDSTLSFLWPHVSANQNSIPRNTDSRQVT